MPKSISPLNRELNIPAHSVTIIYTSSVIWYDVATYLNVIRYEVKSIRKPPSNFFDPRFVQEKIDPLAKTRCHSRTRRAN